MTALAHRHCRPVTGTALPAAEIAALIAQVPGWQLVDSALQKQFAFSDYARMISFVNAVAWLAQREDHHPDLHVVWGRCIVRWHTHSVGGLSINDFICAAQVDALAP
jgi:4a-hydroxytetrahydrobiopterin dehydratase